MTSTDPNGVSDRPAWECIPQCHNGAILVTTKNKLVGQKLTRGSCFIEVPTMELSASAEVFRKQLNGDFIESHPYEKLSEELGGLPLALAQAAAFMQTNSVTPEAYLGLVEESDATLTRLLGEQFKTLGRDSEILNSVTTTWTISFGYTQRTCPLAADLLSRMAILKRQGIPEALIHEDSVDRLDLTKAIGLLSAFSFVSAIETNEIFGMHRSIHLAIRVWVRLNGTFDRWAVSCLVLISQRFPRATLDTYQIEKICDQYLRNCRSVFVYMQLLPTSNVCAADLARKLAGLLMVHRHFKAAHHVAAYAFRHYDKVLGIDHFRTISSMYLLASILSAQHRSEKIEILLQKYLKDKRQQP